MNRILKIFKAGREKILTLAFFRRELPPGKWSAHALCGFCLILIFFMLLVFTVDPYLHYRKKSVVPTIFNQAYWQIPGVLKFFQYDSVIIGGSTAQNFNLALFREKLNLNPVKATASACYTRTGCLFADMAMTLNPHVRTIIYGFDMFTFFADADFVKQPLTDFLLPGKHDKDWCYWWNYDLLRTYLRDLQIAYLGKYGIRQYTDPDLMFAEKYEIDRREHGLPYMARAVRKGYFRTTLLVKQLTPKQAVEHFRQNLEKNILPVVRRYPDVTFIFYFSPFSALNLADARLNGYLELLFTERNMIADCLLAQKNVIFYDFLVAPETLSVDHYKDLVHYEPLINDRMTEWIRQGKYRIRSSREIRENNKILARYAELSMPQLREVCRAAGVPLPENQTPVSKAGEKR